MKKTVKPKPNQKKVSASKSKKSTVSLVGRGFLSKHFRLVEHKHTIKLIHHRHTSHFSLMLILVALGFFLFAGDYPIGAMTSSGDIQVNVIVPGDPPVEGAIITTPKNGDNIIDKSSINVSGTCPVDTYVVIKNNSILAGTVNCTTAGIFDIDIQIYLGVNKIIAQNYDNYNQAGPETSSVDVNLSMTSQVGVVDKPQITEPPVVVPNIPDNPSVIPGKDDNSNCESYDYGALPSGDVPYISIVCIPRLFNANIQQYMGVLVWSGVAPYAVSIDLGNDTEPILKSFPDRGYYRVAFSYKKSGKYEIAAKLTDQTNHVSIIQTAVQVNGASDSPAPTPIASTGRIWFNTPVPIYALAVAITLGFWGGDIFDRNFGSNKKTQRIRRA